MNRVETFTFRVNHDERRAIADLARRLQRSQSDAVRFVVIQAAKQSSQAASALIDIQSLQEIKQDVKHVTQ